MICSGGSRVTAVWIGTSFGVIPSLASALMKGTIDGRATPIALGLPLRDLRGDRRPVRGLGRHPQHVQVDAESLATSTAVPMNVRVDAGVDRHHERLLAPAAAEADAPPTTSVRRRSEKDLGLVRSNTLAPAPRMPGRFAAVVPVSKLPVEPNSASDP